MLSSDRILAARIDEGEDDGRQGIYNALSIIENLSELQPHALEAICDKTELVEMVCGYS